MVVIEKALRKNSKIFLSLSDCLKYFLCVFMKGYELISKEIDMLMKLSCAGTLIAPAEILQVLSVKGTFCLLKPSCEFRMFKRLFTRRLKLLASARRTCRIKI